MWRCAEIFCPAGVWFVLLGSVSLVEVFGLFVLDFPLSVMDFIICLGVYTDVFSISLSQWSLACSSVSNLM